MIDPKNRVFAIDTDPDTGWGTFVQPLPKVLDWHMGTSKKLFTPASLIADFEAVRVKVSRQAINSALQSLLKQKLIVKAERGQYHHRNAHW